MTATWINTETLKDQLAKFFQDNRDDLNQFGSKVNQTFEAFVFASLIKWYSDHGWKVTLKHPQLNQSAVKLKFSTRGRPEGYTYAICVKDERKIQIRHQLRVATKYHKSGQFPPANVMLDVAVISDQDLSEYKTNDYISNATLLTFGEAKHMSAFAELIANFVGLAHELKPEVLVNMRTLNNLSVNRDHPAPFLYVSGYLLPTARGLLKTVEERGYDIDVYDHETGSFFGVTLPVMSPPPKTAM
ncbi:MAG: hypothetical protein BroJett011_41720 [Chloroflexota bacterium]|nr:MAG: hypothetical protein BroJett011_41720 [Chloroflexota bacterium]